MVDHPHLYADYWHINTDLKLLKSIDHKNIESLVEKAAGTYYTLRTITNTTVKLMVPIISGEVFMPFILITPKMFELKIRFIDV